MIKNPFRRKPIELSSGYKVRPSKGKCPECRVGEREYCKPECTLIDGCDPRDR